MIIFAINVILIVLPVLVLDKICVLNAQIINSTNLNKQDAILTVTMATIKEVILYVQLAQEIVLHAQILLKTVLHA